MRQANDAGRSIEDALAGLCFVWMLTCLLDGAFLVMGQSAYVFGPIKHTSALTAWPAPAIIFLYDVHGPLLREIVPSANLPRSRANALSI